MSRSNPLSELPNLGPRSREMLAQAGIATLAQLRQAGSVGAYLRARRANPNVSLNLLWAIEGLLTGVPWQTVARDHRTSLLLALETQERGLKPATPADAQPRARRSARRG